MFGDRVPPHDLELERNLLGSLIIDPEKLPYVADYVTAQSFYRTANQHLYQAIQTLADEGRPIDAVTVYDEAKKHYVALTIDEIMMILDSVATGEFAEEYAIRVKEKADRRLVIQESAAAISGAFDPNTPVTEVVASMEKAMMSVTTTSLRARQDSSIRKMLVDVWEDFLDNQGVEPDMVKTGFYDLDRIIGGFVDGSTTILGGRARMGKTSLALDLCRNCAAQKKRALFFSLEQTKERLVKKLISQEAMISHFDFAVKRKLNQGEIERVHERFQALVDMQIGILDGSWNVHEIRRRCIQEKRQGPLNLIMVDYVQLLSLPERMKFESRNNELTYYSDCLQKLAIELRVPMVILSQLGRDTEKRVDKKPVLTDLKESGGLEQNCDTVIFVYREAEYNIEAPADLGEIIVAKHRDGGTGKIDLHWVAHAATFRNRNKQQRIV